MNDRPSKQPETEPRGLGCTAVVMPARVWRKMTPQEYAEQQERFGRHVAVSQEIVEGCQEVWVFLGGFIQFNEA